MQVVVASRIIARFGYEDLTLGHVSVRSPDGESMFIKAKGASLRNVTMNDVIEVRLRDPDAISTPGMHLESVMHLETYLARDEVGSVIHGHPVYATALGSTEEDLAFVSHDAVLFHKGVGRYDRSADLITNHDQGKEVAQSLGDKRATFLQNHGVMVVGEDVRWAVLAGVTLERAAQMQSIASTIGKINPIPEDEAAGMFANKYRDAFLDEYWEYWVLDLGLDLQGAGAL